ncbi:MAG TPA: fumarate hydratase [Syntrophorhabdus aromaticivorans]|jgi:fumarate hydratase subunit beta|nr:fumarate hydratase [Syntrophorhabdus aromaticivorans]
MLILTPVADSVISSLKIYDKLEITGSIYTGRDAALPKLVQMIEKDELEKYGINLNGSIIFHTAVSPAGIGPTSSNKLDIEGSIPMLSKAGVKIHIGKGRLSQTTVDVLKEYNSIFAVNPPVSALLTSTIQNKKIVAFEEEGMEAMHVLQVKNFSAIVAIAHGQSIFDDKGDK